MCGDERNNCGCIHDILKKILLLQKQDFDNECYAGCDKPYLGTNMYYYLLQYKTYYVIQLL